MNTIQIQLTEEQLSRLKARAERLGLEPEELARASLQDVLALPEEAFLSAMIYVLQKNKELYRRLAT